MDSVNYQASTSKHDDFQEPSVDIVDSKSNKSYTSDDYTSLQSDDKVLINRPSDDPWRQQKLPSWQPILTADTVLPAFFLIGIACIPIGVGILLSSINVQEIELNYTDCAELLNPTKHCSSVIEENQNQPNSYACTCRMNFTLTQQMKAPVFFYYGLSGYYQNHRRYVQSRDDSQLKGKQINSADDLSSKCDPFRESDGQPIAPCGAIANSFFTDTFRLFLRNNNSAQTEEGINLYEEDIAWPTDIYFKFDNPSTEWGTAKPPKWPQDIYPLTNGYRNEHFIIWMRTAAFPTFRKLWGRVDHEQNPKWSTSLPSGNYFVEIKYRYPVVDFKGKKHIIISNTSWLGGKNNFLGIAYITFGASCLVLWVAFLIIVKKYSQNPKDVVDIGPRTPFKYFKK